MERTKDHVESLDDHSDSKSVWIAAVTAIHKKLVAWLNRKCPGHGEDLAQDALLKAFQSFNEARVSDRPLPGQIEACKSYLWRTAVTVAMDYYRALQKEESEKTTHERNVHHDVERIRKSVSADEFKEFLVSLPLSTRLILSLRLVDGKSWPDIAEEIGLTRKDAAAVAARYYRVVEKLGA